MSTIGSGSRPESAVMRLSLPSKDPHGISDSWSKRTPGSAIASNPAGFLFVAAFHGKTQRMDAATLYTVVTMLSGRGHRPS